MLAANPYGNESVCFREQLGNTENRWNDGEFSRAETLYCIFHADPPARPPPTCNVASVTLRTAASDLDARHQRLVTDQVHAKKCGVQQPDRLTHLHRSSFHVCFLAERHAASVLFKSANMMAWLKHTAGPRKKTQKQQKKVKKINEESPQSECSRQLHREDFAYAASVQSAINTLLAYMWKCFSMI